MISVIFTCKGRPALTELCLRRLVEVMPEPYELFICYDGSDFDYMHMLSTMMGDIKSKTTTFSNPFGYNRFELINMALEEASGDFIMHVENDFYWKDPSTLDCALNAFHRYPRLGYIRYEHYPFNQKNYYSYNQVDGKDICWMRKDSPYQFTFNPHLRRFKYPNNEPFKTEGFTKQPEQHHNDNYKYVSACMTGDNWRHLGVYSEGGHYKGYYAERFFNERGRFKASFNQYITEFDNISDNPKYRELFRKYMYDNWDKHSS